MNKKVKIKESEIQADNHWKERYLRALADYQNLEKRVSHERINDLAGASRTLILKLLPALDDLERGEEYLKDEGLSFAMKKFKDILQSEGLEKNDVKGKDFDAGVMEAVDFVNTEANLEGKVVEVIKPCYLFKGEVIRVATVRIGKKI